MVKGPFLQAPLEMKLALQPCLLMTRERELALAAGLVQCVARDMSPHMISVREKERQSMRPFGQSAMAYLAYVGRSRVHVCSSLMMAARHWQGTLVPD